MKVDCIRMDNRTIFFSKVFHFVVQKMFGSIMEGQAVYEGLSLEGRISQDFNIKYSNPNVEELESDFDQHQFEQIVHIQKVFKRRKIKQQFDLFRQREFYKTEFYYMPFTEKVLLKFYTLEERASPIRSSKLVSVTRFQNEQLDKEPGYKVFQIIPLTFHKLNHPEGLLTEEQISKLFDLLIFEKLKKKDMFVIEDLASWEMKKILMPKEIGITVQNVSSIMKLPSDTAANHNTAFSDLLKPLDDFLEHKEQKMMPVGSPGQDLLPNFRWELNGDFGATNIEEEEDRVSEAGSSFHHTGSYRPKDDFATPKPPGKTSLFSIVQKHKLMKPKLFALYSLNSLRQELKKKATPALSHKSYTDEDGNEANRGSLKRHSMNIEKEGRQDTDAQKQPEPPVIDQFAFSEKQGSQSSKHSKRSFRIIQTEKVPGESETVKSQKSNLRLRSATGGVTDVLGFPSQPKASLNDGLQFFKKISSSNSSQSKKGEIIHRPSERSKELSEEDSLYKADVNSLVSSKKSSVKVTKTIALVKKDKPSMIVARGKSPFAHTLMAKKEEGPFLSRPIGYTKRAVESRSVESEEDEGELLSAKEIESESISAHSSEIQGRPQKDSRKLKQSVSSNSFSED
jgi:hypothetical protein